MSSKLHRSGSGEPRSGPNDTEGNKQKRDVSSSVSVRGEIEVHIPIKDKEKHDAAEENKNARDRNRFALEVIGLVVVTIYAALTFWQGLSSARSAKAAIDAAKVAEDTLHVSERAYLVFGKPTLDAQKHEVKLPIENIGHIPSGPGMTVVHEATFTLSPDEPRMNFTDLLESHWVRMQFDTSVGGSGEPDIRINLPQISDALIHRGEQGFLTAGETTYNDGFPNTPARTFQFCFYTLYTLSTNELAFVSCDAESGIKLLKGLEHYPQNEEGIPK